MSKAKAIKFSDFPIEYFPLRDSYSERRAMRGEKSKISFPKSSGIPKTRVKSAFIPSPAIFAFGLPEDDIPND